MSQRFATPRLVVIKVGSSSLRGEDGRLDRDQVANICGQVADLREQGIQVVVVSSGAVAAGLGSLGMQSRPADLPSLQAAAAVGQGELIHEYQLRLRERGLACAQILLSQDDFVRRGRYLTGRSTLKKLLELGAVPVINENDAVTTEELAYGDNDHLAALVASMLRADLLLLLSDVEGLYDGDPKSDPDAKLRGSVEDIESIDFAGIGGIGSSVGSGGMRTKVEAARVAVLSAAHAIVANARTPGVIGSAVSGEDVGTWFVSQRKRLESRRLWIGFALSPHGRIRIDAGAAAALRKGGTSLLGVGITQSEGAYVTGDAVEVAGPNGQVVARGLVAYDSNDVERILGHTTAECVEMFGASFSREVIHRDDLVVF